MALEILHYLKITFSFKKSLPEDKSVALDELIVKIGDNLPDSVERIGLIKTFLGEVEKIDRGRYKLSRDHRYIAAWYRTELVEGVKTYGTYRPLKRD